MPKKTSQDPKQNPILLVYPKEITRYGEKAYGGVYLEFRYHREDCEHLQSYWSIDFNEAGGYYDGLTCHYSVNGAPRRQYADEFNGALYGLRYNEVHDLGERKLTFMLKTLKRINRRLEAIAQKEGSTGSFSEYARRIAKIVNSNEIAIGHSRYSIEEGMHKIDDLIRDMRSRCLRLTGNPDEALEERVKKWCGENGYCYPQDVDGQWWAIPPNGVAPLPIDSVMNKI